MGAVAPKTTSELKAGDDYVVMSYTVGALLLIL